MVYSRAQLLKRFKICCILALIFAIAMVAIVIGFAGEITVGLVFLYAAIFVGISVCYPVIFLGLSFNWKKFLLGYIAPIPILSAVIQYIKAIGYGIKAVVAILKKQDSVVIGKKVIEETEEDK